MPLKPSVQVHNMDGVLVAEFWECHRLDPAPIQELRKLYDAHLTAKGRPDLIIDLLGVGFAGSSALSHFVTLQRDRVRPRGGRVLFCNIELNVRETFRASRLEPLFLFAEDRAAALAAVAKPPDDPSAHGGEEPGPSPPPSGPNSLAKSLGGTLLRRSRRGKLS